MLRLGRQGPAANLSRERGQLNQISLRFIFEGVILMNQKIRCQATFSAQGSWAVAKSVV